MKKAKVVLAILAVIIGVAIYINYPKLNFISGFASKNLASAHFIAGRSFAAIDTTDNNFSLIKLATQEQSDARNVISSVYGLIPRETVCRDGLGCVLVNKDFELPKNIPAPKRNILTNELPFPYGNNGKKDTIFDNINYQQLEKALDIAFSNPDSQKTRTVLVAYKNEIVAERYIEGFDENTRILGWSMSKSVLATLYGMLQYQDNITLDYKPFEGEIRMKNPKMNITLNHLLRMQSGLAWNEDYASISDVTKMLFLAPDMTKVQADKEVIAAPTEVWNYSSGTTNLLSGILRKQFSTHQEYLNFPYEALLDKMGMHSMLIETDMYGNFVGSSYTWATTRDWAKFGLLYLNQGHWNGEQFFDARWIDYVSKPTQNSDGVYGAHFWLNAGGKYPDVPRDMYSANGFQGQRVFVIPSKDLVVVRTGLANDGDFDINAFLGQVCKAIP